MASIRLLDRKRHTRTYDDATTPYLISSRDRSPLHSHPHLLRWHLYPERWRERGEPSPQTELSKHTREQRVTGLLIRPEGGGERGKEKKGGGNKRIGGERERERRIYLPGCGTGCERKEPISISIKLWGEILWKNYFFFLPPFSRQIRHERCWREFHRLKFKRQGYCKHAL